MYDFKINKIITNNNTTIVPKNINVIIGPNNSGKSQFLKDIKNILGSQHHFDKKNIIIKDMEYNLPKNKEEFIERYDLNSKVFKNSDNQLVMMKKFFNKEITQLVQLYTMKLMSNMKKMVKR